MATHFAQQVSQHLSALGAGVAGTSPGVAGTCTAREAEAWRSLWALCDGPDWPVAPGPCLTDLRDTLHRHGWGLTQIAAALAPHCCKPEPGDAGQQQQQQGVECACLALRFLNAVVEKLDYFWKEEAATLAQPSGGAGAAPAPAPAPASASASASAPATGMSPTDVADRLTFLWAASSLKELLRRAQGFGAEHGDHSGVDACLRVLATLADCPSARMKVCPLHHAC